MAPEPDRKPSFGADVSIGIMPGALLGDWPVAGVHGQIMGRYDAFVVDRNTPGPRLGLSLWGSGAVGPLQEADELGEYHEIEMTHMGVLGVLRHDPSVPISANAGLGFGRLELGDFWGAPLVLAPLTFEAGVRQRVGKHGFLDWLIRANWATSRSITAETELDEWWLIQLGIIAGGHLQ